VRALVWKREPWLARHWFLLLVWFAFTWVVEAASDHGLWLYAALVLWIGMLVRLPSHLPSRPFFGHRRRPMNPETAQPAPDDLS
jgi:hypothetical protein